MLRTFQIPYAGAVVISVPDGRVLAMVGRSAADPRLGAAELALRPWAPAASVFKVVSATALVDERRLGRDPHLLPRRRLVDPARQPGRHPGHRSALRHAGLRHRQVAERHHRQAGDPPPDRRGPRPRSATASASARRSPSTSPSSRRTSTCPRTTAGVRARRGRLLALDAVADARRAAGRDHRQRRRDARPDADRARRRRRRPPRGPARRRAPPGRRRGAPPPRWVG